MTSVEEILNKLKNKAKPNQLKGMAKFGMTVEQRLGVSAQKCERLQKR